ncbi:hypothetical protein HanRHA438_Chr12g0557771 [Helianthus annuus]|nr:hypothetical protein HanHA300_Chr12g0447691 [Helianthus annuus]KAJ0505680.1 hypothetical protein HanHA89_Chr12g0473211 [Helianthus annuus]KAJ0675348.1 hypothetical protein HanLR1_Chr12g0450141 [Helianthus annuus]KAJ0866970.1 hypothetical protein HanRHA438_Chr12g0557771 [Helianthus annuus]
MGSTPPLYSYHYTHNTTHPPLRRRVPPPDHLSQTTSILFSTVSPSSSHLWAPRSVADGPSPMRLQGLQYPVETDHRWLLTVVLRCREPIWKTRNSQKCVV